MLALAAENHGLKTELNVQQKQTKEKVVALQKQIADKVLRNEEIMRQNAKLQKKPAKQNETSLFSVESVKQSKIKNNFKYYTGFVYTQFLCILNFLVPNLKHNELPFKMKKTISSAMKMKIEDQLLLVLMKLRLNLQFHHLGNLFNLSPQDTGAIFREWINYMFYRFGSVPLWPARSTIISMMPRQFREDFPKTMIILDGTEIKLEKPSALRSQSQFYSDYKSCTTLKGLVGVDPRGSFIFISMLFTGGTSDNYITEKSGLLEMMKRLLDCGHLQKGDGVMVDKGFLIKEEIEKLGLELVIPPFASATEQMSPSDVSLTQKIAKHRIHVERAISRVKKFKIVDHRVDISLFPCINQIWFCCCFLTGFMPLLIKGEENEMLIT